MILLVCASPLTSSCYPTAPAILSQLYIEGAMSKFYPKYAQTKEGFNRFVREFSWPGGMPSHVNVSENV